MKQPVGVILAGGLARRMGGGNKALLDLGGRTLLAHVKARLAPQCADLALSANGDPAQFARFGLPVLADDMPGHAGPLAGVLAGLDWAAGQGAQTLVTAPVDTPFLPCDLVPRLLLAAEGMARPCAVAASGRRDAPRRHPVCALWPVAARGALRAALGRGEARVGGWAETLGAAVAVFDGADPDPFFNVNTKEDLAAARARLDADG